MAENILPGEHDWMYGTGGGMNTGMGFPSPAPARGPGFMDRLGGLLGGGGAYAGMLDEEQKKALQKQALLSMGANLMANSGWSPQRTSFGQALGNSILATQQQAGQQGQDMLQAMLLKAKLNQKERKRPTAVLGPNGQPVFVDEQDAIGKQPFMKAGSEYGAYQPGDYTPTSWAKFVQTKNPADLERYVTPRQEYSPSYQNVTRTMPDGSTQQGTFDTRTGAYNWTGELVPPGQKARVEAEGRAAGEIVGTRSAKGPTAYATYQAGVKSLEDAMSATSTGPLAGRIPAFTSNQQIAEGAEATMAPVLKELFRSSGEGTFTDADQALLMKMVPSRTDHAEARKAKLEMIDGIVRAKLGISTSDQATERPPLSSFQK
jgi:hypothetical protein